VPLGDYPDGSGNEIILSSGKLTGKDARDITEQLDFLIDLANPKREWVPIIMISDSSRVGRVRP